MLPQLSGLIATHVVGCVEPPRGKKIPTMTKLWLAPTNKTTTLVLSSISLIHSNSMPTFVLSMCISQYGDHFYLCTIKHLKSIGNIYMTCNAHFIKSFKHLNETKTDFVEHVAIDV